MPNAEWNKVIKLAAAKATEIRKKTGIKQSEAMSKAWKTPEIMAAHAAYNAKHKKK
jgi:hypothetical protein